MRRVFLGCLLISMMVLPCLAADENAAAKEDGSRLELDEIVVTASKMDEPINQVPRNITVITSEDIEQAPSKNIVDLLNREVGINLRSLFGSDKQAVVDIRGMGATAASNVVVLVDGVRMNSPDLSGYDFSTIPLEMIERIEVIRGGGSVLYGNGVVGGVINIVTRKGTPGTETRIYASYGSYETLDTRAGVSGSLQDLGFHLNAGYYDADGYRDNGELIKRDLSGVLDYFLTDDITLNLSSAYHEDEYGLPGPVQKNDIDSATNRVQTDFPDDGGETIDQRISGGFDLDTDRWGSLKLVRGYRWRENEYIVGYTPLLDKNDQTDRIEEFTKTLSAVYEKDVSLFGRQHSFLIGLDHMFTDYIREEVPGGPRQNSRIESLGGFVNNRWQLSDRIRLQWGYRINDTDGKYREDQLVSSGDEKRWVNGDTDDIDWWNTAHDLGLTYEISRQMLIYGSYATHFRTPNVDELAESEEDLRPQKGYQLEGGGRFKISDQLEWSLAIFNIVIQDELHYSEINRNYDERTIRKGIETEFKWHPSEKLFVWSNYSYIDAFFEGNDATVPLVPRHKGSIGTEWSPAHGWTVSLTGTYVGSRYDGNDVENDRYDTLDAYQVFDTKLSYALNGFKFFAGINNILDELYETSSFSERYYPMPGRNLYAGIEARF